MKLLKKYKIIIVIAVLALISAYTIKVYCCDEQNIKYTDITIENIVVDSVKVYLTLQSPNSVVGMFGIKASDTTGSSSQGYFYALKDSLYHLNYKKPLKGWNVSFEGAPTGCQKAIKDGFKNGINIVEGTINVMNESFDISCVDGINCVIKTFVTDSSWTTGYSYFEKTFYSAENRLSHQSNLNVRGIFPYRCNNCIGINPVNKPHNCYDLQDKVDSIKVCQVSRNNKGHKVTRGGTIHIQYWGDWQILREK